MSEIGIDLYSDTQTRPTPGMREAIARAPVGDEQREEDPSVNRLCAQARELLGKEAALFLPSGTMCNQIALAVHCQPGDEIIADRTAHIISRGAAIGSEGAGAAAFAGSLVHALEGLRGVYSAEQVEAAVREETRYKPRTALISVPTSSTPKVPARPPSPAPWCTLSKVCAASTVPSRWRRRCARKPAISRAPP